MVATLNRDGISEVFADMLKADTDVLYGATKLVQVITHDPTLYDNAKVDLANPFKMFCWATEEQTDTFQMQSVMEVYTINIRIVGKLSIVQDMIKMLDKINERIKYLVNAQMFGADRFAAYYTDTDARIENCYITNSTIEPPEYTENNTLQTACEGVGEMLIHRLF